MMMKLVLMERFFAEEDGAAAVEYAVLVAVIAGAVFAAIQVFNLNGIFGAVSTAVNGIVTNATN
jgi:Flp pilus assembly pilin Flp